MKTKIDIEADLLARTKSKPCGPKEARQDYLARLVRKAAEAHDSVWKTLAEDTQAWVNANIESMNAKNDLLDFNDDDAPTAESIEEEAVAATAAEEEEEEVEEEDEEEEEELEEEDEEVDDDEEEASAAPAPVKKATPPKAAPAPAPAKTAPPSMPKRAAAPAAPAASVAPVPPRPPEVARAPRKHGVGPRFRELVIENPDKTVAQLVAQLEAEGMTIAASTATTLAYEVRAVLELLTARGMLATPGTKKK